MYTDIHTHILHSTDDGPVSKDEMLEMLELAYNDGVRILCATPHFSYSFYGDNSSHADAAFSELTEAAKSRFPDMKIVRGNEIFYHDSCVEHLSSGACRTLNGTKYILVDFSSGEESYVIVNAMKKLIGIGYKPILAHPERYLCFKYKAEKIKPLKDFGVLIQINAQSVLGMNGKKPQKMCKKLIKLGLCDIVASDSHNIYSRKCCMQKAAEYLKKVRQ